MSRYICHGTTVDGNGRVIVSATVSVYEAGGTTAASIYSAASGGTAVNSVTSDSSNGKFSFYVDDGDYGLTQKFKVSFSKSGYETVSFDNIVILPTNNIDTDVALTANSDLKVPSQKAAKAYVASYATANSQPLDAELTAIAGLVSIADTLPYFTGSGTADLATFSDVGRDIVKQSDIYSVRYYLESEREMVYNLKLVVNASVNKLDIFSKSFGIAPTTVHPIKVMIPDGTGYTQRTRAATYLSGTSQFVLADAGNYWSKGTLDAEIKTAYVYAIWDGTGIVWALAGYSGFHMVPTTTTLTDDDYFLPEASSTYTRSNSHYCVCIGKIRYQYDIGDTPDHTIQATVEDAPRDFLNPPSDYGYQKNLATTLVQGSEIAAYSAVSVVIKQAGKYTIRGKATATGADTTIILGLSIRTGSATFGSATVKSASSQGNAVAGYDVSTSAFAIIYLNNGDTIHLGCAVNCASGNRTLYGDNTNTGLTSLSFGRID